MKYAVLNEVNPRTLCDDVVCLNTMNARSFLCFFYFYSLFGKFTSLSAMNPLFPIRKFLSSKHRRPNGRRR